MKTVVCQHCSHEWSYKGKSKWYASCPDCRYKVSLRAKKGAKM